MAKKMKMKFAMEKHKTKTIRTTTAIFLLLFLSFLGTSVFAGDATAVFAYQMMSEAPTNFKTFLWTGQVNAAVGPTTQNWNMPVIERWGVGSRYPDHNVQPYSLTDPGFSGPNGESYGIEIEFGDTTIAPRSPKSKNVRFYTDFGQTGITGSGPDRAEVHIHSTLESLDVVEGISIWLGWSEYFTHLDRKRMSTLFQFRNQPNTNELANDGFTQEQIESLVEGGYTSGGPATAIEAKPINAGLHYHFATRSGTPLNWTIPDGHTHTRTAEIETGKWYDIIVQIKYSQNSDGRFRVWLYEANNQHTYTVTDNPEWEYLGATMYKYPDYYNKPIPRMEFRTGVYRYNAKNATDITEDDRFMVKYMGPFRLWVGDGDNGFDKVKPR
jgi:hypothetical protein